VMTLSWRSSLRASGQGPPPCRGPSPHRCLSAPGSSSSSTALAATPPVRPLRRRHLFLVLPPGRARVGGPWRPPSPRRGTWCGSWPWEQPDASASTGCTLALFPQPMVGAHLYVAFPSSDGPAGGHAR
jgi:hypothetical protein